MPRKANYPEWVTKHLEKGVYVNHVGDKYYLYRAHSERKPGSRNPIRVFDGYVGTVTEKDGLIPAKVSPDMSSNEISSLDYAVPYAVCACTENVLTGLRRTYRRSGTLIYICAILFFLYGTYASSLYECSWLSLKFPAVSFPDQWNPDAQAGIERGKRMIADKVESFYGNDWNILRAALTPIVLIRYREKLYCPSLSNIAAEMIQKYNLSIYEGKEK